MAYKCLEVVLKDYSIKPIVLFHKGKEHGLRDVINQIEPYSFVWIPDAGTNDAKECYELDKNGCTILITDHHDAEESNPYATIFNSQNPNVINHGACGTLVTYKFIENHLNECPNDYIGFVALATVADMMNLTQPENRYYVNKFIVDPSTRHPFVQDLINMFASNATDLTPRDLSFGIIPKLNAVQRSDNQQLKEDLFDVCINYTEEKSKKIIKQLASVHRKQSNDVKKISAQIENNMMENDNLIIGFNQPSPYTGLFANKLMGTYNKPIFIVHEDGENYTGSMRSTVPIKTILNDSGLINWCQGHEQAAGISFPAKNYNDIVELLNSLDISPEFSVIKSFSANQIQSVGENLFTEFSEHQDLYGQGIDRPLIHIRNIRIKGSEIQSLGTYGTTIKFQIGDVTFIKHFVSKVQRTQWNVGIDEMLDIEIIGFPMMNEFAGNKNKQIEIDKMSVELATTHKDYDNIVLEDLF